MNLKIHPLSIERLDDFLRFFDNDAFRDNQAWSGCYCFFYHSTAEDDAWKCRTKSQNRESTISLIRAGIMRGWLAYDGGKVVGWMNANAKERLARIATDDDFRGIDPLGSRPATIVCFVIAPGSRRQGIASHLLDAAMTGLAKEGYTHVDAFPRNSADTDAKHYHGPLTMYLKAGFVVIKEMPGLSVVRKQLGRIA
jgi:ribosomal protein S18 acetylase RimI-like enzyme